MRPTSPHRVLFFAILFGWTLWMGRVEAQPISPMPLPTNFTYQFSSLDSDGFFDDPAKVDYWTITTSPGQRLFLEVDRQEAHFDPYVWIFAGTISDQSHFVGGDTPGIDALDPGFVTIQDDGVGPFGFYQTQDPRLDIVLTGSATTYTIIVASFISGIEVGGQYEPGDGGDGQYGYRLRASVTTPMPTAIVGRHVFYNNSAFDGNNVATSTADDAAIAPDKTAYRPGTGAARLENYTSYSRGLNGVMIDIVNLPGTPTAADFEFRVGNSNLLANWNAVPEFLVASVSVRRGAGPAGSDRVTIIFADNAIRNQWLQVHILATEETGLAVDDFHYWGNAVGETGNLAGDTRINGSDVSGVQANFTTFTNLANILSRHDINRDTRVNGSDIGIVQVSFTNFSTALVSLNLP